MRTAPRKQSYTRLVWNQYRRDRVANVGLVFVLILFIIALGYYANAVPADLPRRRFSAKSVLWCSLTYVRVL